MPGEYAAIGKPLGPDDFKPEDLIATASLVGGIFGNGGGGELGSAQVYEAARKRFGEKRGAEGVARLPRGRGPRGADDRAGRQALPVRALSRSGRPRAAPRCSIPAASSPRAARRSATPRRPPANASTQQGRTPLASGLQGLFAFPHAKSNALVVSAAHSQSGHPLAVFGPQVGYFAPQILMEQDVHGPGIDARGAAFPGVNLYVELGRGRDYAWSATSAGQDIADTWALPLCDPNGGKPTVDSDYYLYKGACRQMETLTRHNDWQPNLADSDARRQRDAHRSAHGARARVRPRDRSRASRWPT